MTKMGIEAILKKILTGNFGKLVFTTYLKGVNNQEAFEFAV